MPSPTKMNIFVLLLSVCGYFVASSPTVRVEQGELAGTTYTLANGRTLFSFVGVPYAVPPTHKRRFKEPQPLKPWVGVWNATVNPPSCLQYYQVDYSIIGEEDCLYLNVYTPKLPEAGVSPLLPVLFYIHGGAFMFGNGYYLKPDYILKKEDVVVVTINYRLGVLGFFSSGDAITPGNNGLKDQVAALKWVHHNIVQFGGNPASVTIAGCSAGGASVHYHMLSSLSDGLFQKAISLSGTALPPWTLPRNVTQKSLHLSALVGCPTNSTRDMVKCLRKRTARQLVEIMKNFQTWRYCPFTSFGPVVEPVTQNNFLTDEPLQLLKSGRVKNIPWLTSLCKEEGLYPAADFISNDGLLKELDEKWNEIAPHFLMYNYSFSTEQEKDQVSSEIKRHYFGDKVISKETIKEVVQMIGDRAFYNDITRAIKLHVSSTTTAAYCYKFSYRGKYSLSNKYAGNFVDYGTSHADDMLYLLTLLPFNSEETESDVAAVDLMSSIFTSFMKTGTPAVSNVQWEPISLNLNENLRCLDILSPTKQTMTEFNNTQTVEFWKNLLPSEYAAEQTPTLAQVKEEL